AKRRRLREMLLSAPGNWGYVAFAGENWSDGAESVGTLSFRFRFKPASAPMVFFGGSAWIGGLARDSETTALLAVSPLVGLNLLALPAPSSARFTLLSPFVA